MAGEETAVDCWHNGEEGDFGRRGCVGVVGEEGRCETLPDGVGVEGEHEFNGGAG